MAISDKRTNLVWMDLEMTGLDLDKARIIQISLVITNQELETLFNGLELAVHQSDEVLLDAEEWVRTNLKDQLKQSQKSPLSESEAEQQLLEVITQYCDEKTSPLCGNSVSNDKRFLIKYMPTLNNYLSHRSIDVSTVKELFKRWKPGQKLYVKGDAHTALQDIEESIGELKFYRDIGFIG